MIFIAVSSPQVFAVVFTTDGLISRRITVYVPFDGIGVNAPYLINSFYFSFRTLKLLNFGKSIIRNLKLKLTCQFNCKHIK